MGQEDTQVEFNFGSGRIIFGRIMLLGLRKNSNNVSQEYTGQGQMRFYLNYFQQFNAPCTYVSWC